MSGKITAIGVLTVVFAGVALLFGFTGVRTLAAMIVFFFFPFYLLLGRLNLETGERIFFAFFIGIALFSTLVFYAGRLIPSYTVSTVAVFLGLILIALLIRRLT